MIDKEKIREEFEKLKKNISEEDIHKLLDRLNDLYEKFKQGPLKEFSSKLSTLIEMLKSYVSGEYREVPWTSIAGITATLLYVLNPLDIIPDFIPGIGLADDAFMVSLCLKLISSDIEKYKKFTSERENNIKKAEQYDR